MHDDDDLRARFKSAAAADREAAPDLTFGHIDAWRTAMRIQRRQRMRAGTVVGLAAGAVVALTVGLVLGTSTGYASAMEATAPRVQRDPSVRETIGRKSEPSAIGMLKNLPAALACVEPAPQQGIPIVDLPTPTIKTAMTLGGTLGIRVLSDGDILVNDAGHRQMRLFDSTLALKAITLDSVPGLSNSYGPRAVQMTRYIGDSSLVGDYQGQTILVVGPNGQVARAMAALDDYMLTAIALGQSTSDDKGRLLYTTNRREDPMLGLARAKIPDSSVVLRANLEARRIDTLVRLKSSGTMKLMGREGDGPVRYFVEPVQLMDDFALLTDGSIAVVRGRDYHIDWIAPDGSTRAGAKMPFDWKRIPDEEKQRLIDSVRQAHSAGMPTRAPQPAADPNTPTGPGRRVASAGAPQGPRIPMEYVAPDLKDVFDFYPPIRRHAVMADLDGNVWILPTTSAQSKNGELVYDVTNAKGEFWRVRMPGGRSLAGFGKGGVVFLLNGNKTDGFFLEQTKLPARK